MVEGCGEGGGGAGGESQVDLSMQPPASDSCFDCQDMAHIYIQIRIYIYMGGCQNYGPHPLYNTAPNI